MEGFYFFERITPNMGRYFRARKIIANERSDFQSIVIIDTEEFGKVLFLEGLVQIAEKDDFFYHEPLIHPAMLSVEKPKKVLIIGGGDGAALREVLRYKSVEEVHLVDIDKRVIELVKEHMNDVVAGAFDDPRAKVFIQDGRKFVEDKVKEGERYDVVVSDLLEPTGPAKFLWTKEFYENIKKLLIDDGIFTTHCTFLSYPETFSVISNTLKSVFPEVKHHFMFVPSYEEIMAFALAGNSISEEKINKKLSSLPFSLNLFDMENRISFSIPPFLKREMDKFSDKLSTDNNPYEFEIDNYVR